MFNEHRIEMDLGGRKLVLESGKIARQADGAVMASLGDTMVLCTAVGQRSPKPGIDFFPLTVNYQEKNFCRGQNPGRLFQARGTAQRKGNLDLAADRPAAPALVCVRLPERNASYLHGPCP